MIHLQNVLKMSWRRFCKTSWRRLENVLKTSWRRIAKTNILVLTKTSWRRLLKTKTKDVFKTSSRRLHQDECLLGRFLLCVIDICSKCAWVFPLKDKKGVTITNPFQKILKESNRKQSKIWVDKGSEFYNRSMKSWLEKMI